MNFLGSHLVGFPAVDFVRLPSVHCLLCTLYILSEEDKADDNVAAPTGGPGGFPSGGFRKFSSRILIVWEGMLTRIAAPTGAPVAAPLAL